MRDEYQQSSATLRGTIRGNAIVLTTLPKLLEGAEVEVTIRVVKVLGVRPDGIADWWTDEDDRILEEIQ